ncbi:4'-phosphopantetheinyl transferase [Streptomyces sp. NPDC087440]|uniref:4'-phosphopantetheinyl transferase family protein n=1 Tax=Streptomyces sp. NPDC087440 TaxID=3365790 RepID=UPI003823384B
MIERILPEQVAVEWRTQDVFAAAVRALFPEEAAVVDRAVAKRRGEFAAVRLCAREALGALGVAPVPLLPGPRGEPRWPGGVVGSMTHCEGYCAAAVAGVADVLSLGIDAEPDLPLPAGVFEAVVRPEEAERLRRAAWGAVHADRLLFSAKESVYKAWFPLTGRWLDFSEASVEFAVDGSFTARLLVPGPVLPGGRLQVFDGRWMAADGFVLTSVVVPSVRSGAVG